MNQSLDMPVDQKKLVEAWNQTLPRNMNPTDHAEVKADEADPVALRIHIRTAGHTKYTFDFKCTYVDLREVSVQLIDVEADGNSVDEHTEIIQNLAEDYVRHIHECAQSLHKLTNK